MLKRAVVIGAVAAAVVAPASAAVAGHRVPPRCSPGKSRIIAADRQAVVYLTVVRERFGGGVVYAGCAYGHTRAYVLGGPVPREAASSQSNGGITLIALAGHIAAFEEFAESRFGEEGRRSSDQIFVMDLRTGRMLRTVPTGTLNPPNPIDVGVGGAYVLLVKPDGAIAWTVGTGASEGRYQVHVADGSGSREIAAGPDIDPMSLALAGSTLYWTQGGVAHSAPLN